MRRAVIAGALVLGTVFSFGAFLDKVGLGEGTAQASPSSQGDFRISALRFATEVGKEFEPINPRVEFNKDTDFVWVVFEYVNYSGGTLSYVARANGGDYAWGDLNCCQFKEHRIGFKLDRSGEHNASAPSFAQQPGMMSAFGVTEAPALIPGAGYDVYIYLNGIEVGSGGFGVKGKQGLDDNDNQEGSNGNDNN